MLKKFLATLLTFAVLATGYPVAAADLSSALKSFDGVAASVNEPGRYQSGARGVMTAGGFDLRVPPQKNSAQLFSFTPPRIEAGCGGISSFFGGFSFISGKEFEQLLKNIGSGAAMGFVAHLAMKALCPYCESVAQFLQRINQAATQAAKNSCAWGAQMAESFKSSTGMGKSGFGFEAECKAIGPQAGREKDAASASEQLCNSAFSAVEYLESWGKEEVAKAGSEADKKKAADGVGALVQTGNGMWRASGKMFPGSHTDEDLMVFRVWLMNLTGTTLVGTADNVSCAGSKAGDMVNGKNGTPQIYCPGTGGATVDANDVMSLLLCGASPPIPVKDGHANITKFCEQGNTLGTKKAASTVPLAQRKVMVCDPSRNPNDECPHILFVPVETAMVGNKKLFNGTGLMYQVRDLLGEAVRRVVTNTPIYTPGTTDPVGQRIVQMLQVAPYPLYQTINAAAVYPSAALDLIDTMSLLIGESLAYSYADEYLRMAGRAESGAVIDHNAVLRINQAMESIRAKVTERKQLIVQNLTIQETLNANIRQINLAIQRQVMTTDVMNGNKFTATMGGSVISPNGGRGTAPAGVDQ